MEQIFKDPLKLVGLTIVATALLSGFVVVWPFEPIERHGSFADSTPPEALALEGAQVYYEEGCQYCHSQNLRPLPSEVLRFADGESYGDAVLPVATEYMFESPAQRGSTRIGPDLTRVAGRLTEDEVRAVLRGGGQAGSLAASYHPYAGLFETDAGINPLFLSWRIRMLREVAVPLSDPYQKSVWWALEDATRGDALVAYLISLGQRQLQFRGQFYQ